MRIGGGNMQKRALVAPKGESTRPSSSRLRACVFNMCQAEIEGAHFLDLCAGSGAMGFEALSRGARHVTFVDNSSRAIMAISKNARSFELKDQISLHHGDALVALKRIQGPFDIVFIDPPYYRKGQSSPPLSHELAMALMSSGRLAPGALIFIEEASIAPVMSPLPSHIRLHSTRTIGPALLTLLIHEA